ncbi:MAG: EamA family transporter RarD [Phycisphaerales bacterium]|nr:MAG: EamA family transporter RarD [Phycisphaerales bacterium]
MTQSVAHHPDSRAAKSGVAYGVAAYLWWGLAPIYFKAVKSVPAWEVLAHRIIWSAVLLAFLVIVWRRVPIALEAIRSAKTCRVLVATALLVSCNWLIFIWSVAHGYVLQASLGYFINPLVSVVLGLVFLRERLRPWQWASVILAGLSVAYMTLQSDAFPWAAFGMALTFAFYGLLRKTAPVNALIGLTIETVMLLPVALGFLVYLMITGSAVFAARSLWMDGLLALAGVITATPLLWFTESARRLKLSTVGFLQYIAPTGHFLLAVFAYGETFERTQLITFSCIWTALIIFTVDAVRLTRSSGQPRVPRPVRADQQTADGTVAG